MSFISELLKYAKRVLPLWILTILVGWITISCILLAPQVPALIIDRILSPALGRAAKIDNGNVFAFVLDGKAADDYLGKFAMLSIVFFAILLTKHTTHYIRWNLAHRVGVRLERRLRMVAFRKMCTQNSVVMARYTSGDLISICNSDIIVVKNVLVTQLSIFSDVLLLWSVGVVLLIRLSPFLLIMPALAGLCSLIVMRSFVTKMRRCHNIIRQNAVELNTTVQENINGVRIIRAFATEELEKAKFDQKNQQYYQGYMTQARAVSRHQTILNSIGVGMIIGSIAIGVVLGAMGRLTAGQYATFMIYVGFLHNPVTTLASQIEQFQNAYIAGMRLFAFLNTSNIITDPADPMPMADKPDISLQNVCVSIDDAELLQDITLRIPYGSKLGIMGATGSGKTALIKTLPRFFEATKGEVMVGGVDVRRMRVDDVRAAFGYVMQDVFLFSDSVRSNIAFFEPDADMERVVQAAEVSDSYGFVSRMGEGFDTIVGERGVGLSGGQKQRISIARALLKDAPILLLDDCTSALDLTTERQILDAIDRNYSQKTIIIASHRATSVMECDQIIYLEGGKIVEQGTHDQLIALGGRYKDVFDQQTHSTLASLE